MKLEAMVAARCSVARSGEEAGRTRCESEEARHWMSCSVSESEASMRRGIWEKSILSEEENVWQGYSTARCS